jgi:hypothetical protein
MQGIAASSQASATGLVVSGVEETSISVTWSRAIRSLASSPARVGLDWLSRTRISTGWARPPISRPLRKAALTPSTTKLSASPKPNRGPLWGET